MLSVLLSALAAVPFMLNGADSLAVVSGSVYEVVDTGSKTVESPVENAIVSIRDGRDSVMCITDSFGQFLAEDVLAGTVHIKVSKLGYEDYAGSLECKSGVNLILVSLKRKAIKLSSSRVVAEAVPVTHVGDTVVFHPGAVKTLEDDSILEVLAQMPGVSVHGGTIMVNGQVVKRTYVNGRLIFGDTVLAPLQSLLANEVTSVKSYEELNIESRRAGLMVGKKDRVIDIVTRTEIKTAFDGHVLMTIGADETRSEGGDVQARYGGGLVANYFSEEFISYLTVDANNLDKTSFRQDEYLRGNGPITKYRETAGGSAGFEKYWGDRLLGSNLKLSYSYRHDYDSQKRRSASDFFRSDGSLIRADSDTLAAMNASGIHTVEFSSEIHNHSLKNISLYAILSASDDKSKTENGKMSVLEASDRLSEHLAASSRSGVFSVSTFARWSGDYKSGFVPFVSASFDIGRVSGIHGESDTLHTSAVYRNLRAESGSRKASASVGAGFSKFLSNNEHESSSIKAVLDYGFSRDANTRWSKNFSPDGYSEVNYANSYDYIWTSNSIKPEISYSLNRPKWNLSFSATPEFTLKSDTEVFPAEYKTGKWFFVPQLKLESKISNTEIKAGVEHRAPLVSQFRTWTDDRNPLYLLRGNPELVTEKFNSLQVSQAFPRIGKYGSLIIRGSVSVTFDPIVESMYFYPEGGTLLTGYQIPAGAFLLTYSNARHSISGETRVRWQKRYQRLRTSVTVEPGMTITQNPVFFGNDQIHLLTLQPRASLSFVSRPNKQLIFGALERLDNVYSKAVNGLEVSSVLRQNLRAYVRWTFAVIGFANVEYQWMGYKYFRATGSDTNLHSLSAVTGVRLLKGRLGISISCNDILNAGSSYTQTVSSVKREQIWQPSYGRYYLLNISYRIKSRNKDVQYRGQVQEGGDESAPFLRL